MRQDGLVRSAAVFVRVAGVANRLSLVAIAMGLVASLALPHAFARTLLGAGPAIDLPNALAGIRLLMGIGIVMTIAAARLLAALGAIVSSARHGDPFAPDNARRLRTIGWALLTLQLLDIPCTLLARFWPSLGSAAPGGGISVGGWIATLMVFVLARIFASGSAMRDDLAGTV